MSKVHIGTRVWSHGTFLAILEDELTLLVRDNMHHVEICRKEALVLYEVTVVQSSFLCLVCSMRIVYIGIETTANITHLQRAVIILLQMQGDSTILHVHTLNSTIAIRIPLLCFGYRNLVKDKLRGRNELTSIDAVCLYIALLIYLSTMTVRTRVEIIGEEFEEAQSTISRPCAVSVTNIQSLQELLHLLEGDSAVGGVVFCSV